MFVPTVSVVIPTFKHRDFISETLNSVFAQSFEDFEVIVVNDGSPDDTAKVLKRYPSFGRIKYIEQDNAGQAAARNRGLAEARGKFVAFLDDDDLWPADKLQRQVGLLHRHPDSVLAFGPAKPFGRQPDQMPPEIDLASYPSGDVHAAFLRRNWIMSPGQTLIRRETLQKTGGFDGSLWGVDDWDIYLRLAALGQFTFNAETALLYRCHDANASRDLRRMFRNSVRLAQKHRPPDRSLRAAWLIGRRWAVDHEFWVRIAIARVRRHGDWSALRDLPLIAIDAIACQAWKSRGENRPKPAKHPTP